MVNLQLHTPSILFMREVASISRLTSPNVRGMHAKLSVPPSLKVEELILTLGTNRFLLVWP